MKCGSTSCWPNVVEWVARCLERFGHDVIVADPNFAPMYAARSRKIKTNHRDTRALAEACRLGAYRPTHRLRGSRSSAVEPSLQGRRN
jgi:transposase